jgi:galactokinase
MPAADRRSADLFVETFGGVPTGAVRAPGRVNLIGDHTDYNDGFVLPIAIDRDTHIAYRLRNDSQVHIVSEHGDAATFDLASLEHGTAAWSEYVRGMAWALEVDGPGWDAAVASDVPIGAGLSSSAALEIATGLIFDPTTVPMQERTGLALDAQRAENEWVGMSCGIMDQLGVASAEVGHAMLIDCRDLSIEQIPVPDDLAFVVLDTGTRRMLTESAYNERRATCERAAAALDVPSLRSITIDQLVQATDRLDQTSAKRVRHVVTENARVIATAAALRDGDADEVGRIMSRSHRSLRDDFESSTPELDAMVEVATGLDGCHGARVTGAGFGGAAVAVVDRTHVDRFVQDVGDAYRSITGIQPQAHVCVPSAGAAPD